ncbi:MAG TPA: cytochrome c [Steroidobacteraceae bacterium]|jgi:mono/diheme cytochrome c family protein|nr:cytochrome c [Steroidobacteraceae bacterium]
MPRSVAKLAVYAALSAALLLTGRLVLGQAPTPAPAPAPNAAPVAGHGEANAALLPQGEYLAHAADCVACHSAPGGAAYAGGRGMGLPMGTIWTTNITPDADTGIGGYSLQDFDRALRRGIARDGHHLYPSMPYPSYAKLADGDVAALYAYFMLSVKPVHQVNHPPQVSWPISMRWLMVFWNAFFLDTHSYQNATDHDAQWNRGAYLVQGAGHCGACHTPRGWLFEEKALSERGGDYLAGAPLDNWSAADLTGDGAYGLGRWSEADLVQFLKTGHNAGGTAFGSMIDVINYSTQYLSDADNTAIAHYLKSLPPAHRDAPQTWQANPASAAALNQLQFGARGSQIYYQYCGDCHRRDGSGQAPYIPPLAGNPAVLDSDPISLVNVTLNGSSPVVVAGNPDFYRMASFRGLLDDEQLADVLTYLRSAWGNSAGAVNPEQVRSLRSTTGAVQVEELNLLRMR